MVIRGVVGRSIDCGLRGEEAEEGEGEGGIHTKRNGTKRDELKHDGAGQRSVCF